MTAVQSVQGAPYDGPPILSASQISVWQECERKWGWQYVAHLPRPQGPGAALGERTHKQLELYLLEGRPLQFTTETGEEDESGYLAAEALPHLPAPKTPGLEVEGKKVPGEKREGFYFSSPRTGIIYHGYIDWRLPDGGDGIPVVGDHKTSSSISKYALTPDKLRADPQGVLYAVDTMSRFKVPYVRLQWTYMQTRGARKSLPVIIEVDSEHVAREFERLEKVAVQISTTLNRVPRDVDQAGLNAFVESLEPNPNACRNYGGCPYTSVCNLGPRDFWRAKLGQGETTEMSNMDLINRLRNRADAAPTPAAVPEATTTPGGTIKYNESWAQAPSDVAAAAQAPTLPAVASVAINPPGEYQPPPTAEQRDGVMAVPVEAPKRGRGRPKKDATPQPITAQATAVTPAPAEASQAPQTAAPDSKETPGHLIDVLFIDCIPMTGEDHMTGAQLAVEANEAVEEATQKADYRFLEYGQGPGALLRAALQVLSEQGAPPSLTLDTRTPEGAILCNELTARAAHVVRGLR